MTKPSSFASSSASAKLWLPPVSSNGLYRTRPTRWTARRPLDSSTAERADSSSTLAGDAKTLSRWASRTASRLRPSAPRVSPSSRWPRLADPARLDDDEDEEDDDGDAEPDDGHADVRCDGGVQVDRTVLRRAERVARRVARV